jgi:tellurite resistance protein TerC
MNLPTVVAPWLWPAFIGGVLALLFFDLVILQKRHKHMTHVQALGWSAFWVSLALAFTGWFTFEYGKELGVPFLTAYLVEQSLSVDNLFVIFLIFQAFRIPKDNQHRVLYWGILGAIVFRGILIILGVDLIHRFDWLMYVFGAILIFTAAKLLMGSDENSDVMDSWIVRWSKKVVPMTNVFHGENFFFKEGGRRVATPLFLALVVIEVSDIVFAVDSIPAVLAITNDAFVAFASNILAILGLRSLYFIIAEWVAKLRYLKPGLSVILGFIGVKMLISHYYKIPSLVSLAIILGVLLTAGLTSWYVAKRGPPVGKGK